MQVQSLHVTTPKPGISNLSSTPIVGVGRQILSGPGLSAISASSSQSATEGEHASVTPTLSGIEEIVEVEHHVNPLKSLTIEIDDDLESEREHEDDEDYEPSLNMTIGPKGYEDVAEISVMESVLGLEDEGTGEDDEETDVEESKEEGSESHKWTGVRKVLREEYAECIVDGETVIVYMEQLLSLANRDSVKNCMVKGCHASFDMVTKFVASAVFLTWVCKNKHTGFKWSSQPVMQSKMNGGDLMIASAVLAFANNFQKILLFARFLNLHFILPVTFFRMQTVYLVPAIEEHWEEMQKEIVAELQGKDIVLLDKNLNFVGLGDGRMDSPGHSAQYCTYSFIDNETKKIVTCKSVDKRETNLKSSNMVMAGFTKALNEAKEKLHVVEVVTDAHM